MGLHGSSRQPLNAVATRPSFHLPSQSFASSLCLPDLGQQLRLIGPNCEPSTINSRAKLV